MGDGGTMAAPQKRDLEATLKPPPASGFQGRAAGLGGHKWQLVKDRGGVPYRAIGGIPTAPIRQAPTCPTSTHRSQAEAKTQKQHPVWSENSIGMEAKGSPT